MENSTVCGSYEKAKREAKEFYHSIGRVWCPTLEDNVTFNSPGFRHLVRKGSKPRSRRDQMRRFALLYFAPDIISDTSAEAACREREKTSDGSLGDRKARTLSSARFWTAATKSRGQILMVVVRQIGAGQKHFFSIYNQKIAR
jgi:hypothetical protein